MKDGISDEFKSIPLYFDLPESIQLEISKLMRGVYLTFQQKRLICEMIADFYCWKEDLLYDVVRKIKKKHPKWDQLNPKQRGSFFFNELSFLYQEKTKEQKQYREFEVDNPINEAVVINHVNPGGSIMGQCPVASTHTRCCNLNTLDAVWQCGFDCSYCSIQSFYYGNQVRFVENLDKRLEKITNELDSSKQYHIGTGQSSDSLMWGNREGLLQNLSDFANKNKNIILEMKSKSSNISWFENNDFASNMVFSWSLNTPEVIRVEERGSATLKARLDAARKMANLKAPVGFHFHPMIYYKNWKEDYSNIVNQLVNRFSSNEVMMISIGTLTFIKPVLKKIRGRLLASKVLQMPFKEIAGKYSYPYFLKREMFSYLYSCFPDDWKKDCYFYLCMEDFNLWDDVFGFSYDTNEAFEEAMLEHYFNFIDL